MPTLADIIIFSPADITNCNNKVQNVPQNIIFQLHIIVIPAKNTIALLVSSEISHSKLYLSPDFYKRITWLFLERIHQPKSWSQDLPAYPSCTWSSGHLRTVPDSCLELGDASSNLQPCHEFVFCHKWSMGLCFNFPHCPLSSNNHKYCPESLSHNLKCDPAQLPIRRPSGRWKKSIWVSEWSRL